MTFLTLHHRVCAKFLAGALCCLFPLVSGAATIVVDGVCTLPDAIHAANSDLPVGNCSAGSGADTIVLSVDVAVAAVSVVDGQFGEYGLPLIESEITIDGGGHSISRTGGVHFRLLGVKGLLQLPLGAVGSLTLVNVSLQNGDSTASTGTNPFFAKAGGAILNTGGSVTVTDSTLAGNKAVSGGAIANLGGTVTIMHSTFGGSAPNLAVIGGAIYSFGSRFENGQTVPGTVTTRSSLFLENEARNDLSNALVFVGNFGSSGSGGAVSNWAVYEDIGSSFLRNRAGCGGAISNSSFTGQATLINSRIEENTAGSGGAVFNFNASDVMTRNARIRGNVLGSPSGGPSGQEPSFFCQTQDGSGGGGISTQGSGAAVHATDSLIEQNGSTSALQTGGGILVGSGGRAAIENSVVSGNTAQKGAGVFADTFSAAPALTLENVDVAGNTGVSEAALVIRETSASILASRISGNTSSSAFSTGGGIFVSRSGVLIPTIRIADSLISGNVGGDGGGIFSKATDLEIDRSAISNNTGRNLALGGVGGIHQDEPFFGADTPLVLRNSTVSGNAGAVGGIRNEGNMLVQNSTILQNSASGSAGGGGILNLRNLTVQKSIVGLNSATQAPAFGDCRDLIGGIDGGNNLNTDASCTGFTVATPAQLAMGPLANNGGATPTHALGAGSVAINAIPTGCVEVGNVDQRSAGRETSCDIGSFEAGRILSVVSFAQATSSVFEGSGLHRVAIRVDNRGGNLASGEITLYLRIMGTAAPGADYAFLSERPITVAVPPAGVLSTTDVEFDVLDDNEFEGDETITLKLTLVGPAGLGANEHVVTIRDNDGNNLCSVAQIDVQQTVGDFDPARYRNKGAQMKLVNQVLKSFERSNGELPEGCRGCIVSQFARGVLIADQAACTSGYREP